MVISDISIFILVTKAILLVSAEPESENYRLPNIYEVLDYKVNLLLNPELFTENGTQFPGEVEIRFKFKNVTDYIALHAAYNSIEFHNVSFENTELPTSNYSVNNVTNILTVYVGIPVTTGILYHLNIRYTGTVNTKGLYGLYRSSYVDKNGETKYLLTTQLGSTARMVFPCFNEPGFKAYFNFTVTFPSHLNVLFSTKTVSLMAANTTGTMTRAQFQQTPRIAPGSLALIVSDLTCTDAHDDVIPLKVCSREETASLRDLPLQIVPKLLAFLNNFMNFNYNRIVGKLDIVAMPDFPAAASANLGLEVHKEDELLWDDAESSNKQKEDITLIITHELSHQWFFNLLTCQWYSEMFMSEGFARYFEYYTVNEVFPQYEVEKRFIIEILHQVLVEDGNGGAAPLHIESISTPSEISSAYSSIAYDKGGSIIRMVSYFMSRDNFRTGIRNFVEKYQYGNIDSEGLWTELNKTIMDSISKMPANLSTVMRNWIREPGYPLVTVSLTGENLTISQSKFSYFGEASKTKWYIPISYTQSAHLSKFQSTTPDFWLTPDSDYHARFPPESDWLILNNQQIGYYRVNYDSVLWAKIKTALQKEEFDGITDINRAQVIDDLFNLARANILPYSSVLDTIRFLKNDTSYAPWKAAIDGFEIILRRVGEYTDLGKAVGKDMLDLIDNFYNSVPLSILKDDDHKYTIKQLLAVDWACRLGHKNCIKDVLKLFKAYRDTGNRPNAELRYVVYCNGLRYSDDDSDWYFMWDAFLNTDQPSEEKVLRTTLGCSHNSTLLKNYLQKTITKDSGVKPQDALHVFTAVGGNAAGVDVAFNFLMDNQEQVAEYYQTMGSVEFLFIGITERLSTEEQKKKVIDMINDGELKSGFKEHGEQALFVVESSRIWLSKYSQDLAIYYKVDTFNYMSLLSLLVLIPLFLIVVFVYCWSTRREQLLIWIANMNPMNIWRRNDQAPTNDIQMRET